MGLAAGRYEVHYKSRSWRAWGMTNNAQASLMARQLATDAVKGNSMTIKGKSGGRVQVKDVTTKKIVAEIPVEGDAVRAFMDSLAVDLEEMSVEEFQMKWNIPA
jgi:hypothetical protein